MSIIKFSIVAAMNTLRGIGAQGGLPWRLSGDMKFFKTLTMQTVVRIGVPYSPLGFPEAERCDYGKKDIPILPRAIPSS